MSLFDNEVRVHNTLAGEVSIESMARPQIKLNTKPRIVICMPIGPKNQSSVFPDLDGQKLLAPSVTIPGCVPIQWVMAHMRMVPPLGISTCFISQWGMLSGEARQIMTSRALKLVQDDGYVLYWDDDIIIEPLSLYTLYSFMEQNPHVGGVTAVYSTRQEPSEPVIYKEHMKGSYWGLTVGPNAIPEEIFACGAGFMLVRARALRDMVAKNPGRPVWADAKTVTEPTEQGDVRFTNSWGHDIRFCALMAEAGWPMYVDGRVEVGHYDVNQQKEYRLPEDSPPKVRGREVKEVQRGTIALVMPTHNDLDYAARCAASFVKNTTALAPIVIAVDDASEGQTAESYAAWAKAAGIYKHERYEQHGGMTRSWNRGLQIARQLGVEYAVCGNADTLFSVGWDADLVQSLETYDLVGPVTNCPGWGTPRQAVGTYLPDYEVDDATVDATSERLRGLAPVELDAPALRYGTTEEGAVIGIREFLNGFCMVAKTATWFAGGFDKDNAFNPDNENIHNENELQFRWGMQGGRRAILPSSFVFHYRSVSRGDEYLCDGAFRPAVPTEAK